MRLYTVLLIFLLPCLVQAQQKHSDGIDDVLQYTPYATVFALKACGMESEQEWGPMAATTVASFVASAGIGYIMKHTIKEWRPDNTDQKSMPSGHSIVAFAGATMLYHEYGKVSPWISIAGYGVAAFTAVDRVVKDRHHWYDVAAGAAIGFVATELTWWLSKKLFQRKKNQVLIGFSGNTLDLAVAF